VDRESGARIWAERRRPAFRAQEVRDAQRREACCKRKGRLDADGLPDDAPQRVRASSLRIAVALANDQRTVLDWLRSLAWRPTSPAISYLALLCWEHRPALACVDS
jgi:hypothetical protein